MHNGILVMLMKIALVVIAMCVLLLTLFAAGEEYGQPESAVHGKGFGTSAGQGSGQVEQAALERQVQNRGAQQPDTLGQEKNQAGQGSPRQYRGMPENSSQMRLRVREMEAYSSFNITSTQEQNRTRLYAQLSNGRNAEIKVMPDTASETALSRLRIRNCNESNGCTIQVKEVGGGNQARAAYVMKATKRAKLFALFDVDMQVKAEVDAENGETISTEKPWWAFLATEQEE